MVTFTANKALGLPAVGGDTGVWGPPLNNNSSVLDASLGGLVTVPISSVAGAITFLASNYNNTFIVLTGAITQNTVITLPAVGSFYTFRNTTTNTSQFTVTLQTTAAGGRVIGVPPYQAQDIYTDGTNVHFQGLPHVGSYWDYAGSSIPAWVSVCTVPPWLYCNGTTFSSATYPYLATILGSTTLPDLRGRFRATINDGTARLTSTGGIDGNTIYASGGAQTVTLSTNQIPALGVTVVSNTPVVPLVGTPTGVQSGSGITQGTLTSTGSANAGSPNSPVPTVPPAFIAGITMIRGG